MSELPDYLHEESLLRRLKRCAWCGLYAGAIGGATTTAFYWLAPASDALPDPKIAAAIILSAAIGAYLFHLLRASRLHPFGLAAFLGGVAFSLLAELAIRTFMGITWEIGAYPAGVGLLLGAPLGAIVGLLCGCVLSLLPVAFLDRLQPWGWLVAASIIVVLQLWTFLVDWTLRINPRDLPALGVFFFGFAFAGWIAQNEYLRLRKKPLH